MYENVVRQYKVFFGFAFKYFFLIVATIIAIIFFGTIFLGSTGPFAQDDPFLLQRTKLVKTFDKFLQQTVANHDIAISIMQGPLLVQNDFLISQDNFITYKGFVVPKSLTIATTLPLKSLNYFESDSYATGELMNFVNNFILVSQHTTTQIVHNTQIPLNGSLATTFNLGCLAGTKLSSATCNYYLDSFLSSFFVYQLDRDYIGLTTIYQKIQNVPKYKNLFCSTLKKYLLYTNDTHESLNPLFSSCGDTYLAFFETMEGFIGIQQELNNRVVTPNVYKDKLLNAYKLLSYQQILYQDFENFKIRGNEYSLYISYVESLLKRNGVDQFYLDELYRYNNEYLKPTLLITRYDDRFTNIKDADITKTVKAIDMINAGNPLEGYTGLALQVKNPNIPSSVSAHTPPSTQQDTIAKRLATVSFLTISQSMNAQDEVSIKGYLVLGNQKVAVSLGLLYQDDNFLVKDISLPDFPSLSSSLQGLISNRDTTLGEIYANISKNIDLYQEDTTTIKDIQSLCADIQTLEESLKMTVSTCTDDALVLSKLWDGHTVTYTFFLQDFAPTSLVISDSDVESAVSQNKISLQEGSLKDVVKKLLVIAPTTPITIHEGGADSLSALSTIQKYLNITPNDVAEKSGQVLVDITLQSIHFIARYDGTSQTLGPRYFKDVLVNGKPYSIQKLSLQLTDTNQDTINDFVKDPLLYIKKTDLTARQNYTKK